MNENKVRTLDSSVIVSSSPEGTTPSFKLKFEANTYIRHAKIRKQNIYFKRNKPKIDALMASKFLNYYYTLYSQSPKQVRCCCRQKALTILQSFCCREQFYLILLAYISFFGTEFDRNYGKAPQKFGRLRRQKEENKKRPLSLSAQTPPRPP